MKNAPLKDKMFILLILSSIYAYFIHSFVSIISRKYVLWTYVGSSINVGLLGKTLIYLKDVLAVLLLFYYILDKRKIVKIRLAIVCLIFSYGILILLIRENFDIRYVIAGARSYIFFIISIMWCIDRKINYYVKTDNIISKILISSIYIQTLLVFSQVALSKSWKYFGGGGYRFCGSFANSGGLGYYCIAISLYIIVISVIKKAYKKITIIHMFLLTLISIASGMRLAIIIVIFIYILFIIMKLYDTIHLDKRTIIVFFSIVIFVSANVIFEQVINRINRGAIMKSGGTRLKVFKNLIFNNDILNSIIGNGLGYGTNTAVNLGIVNLDSGVYDGTLNTIIAQIGIIGFIVFIIASIITFINICLKSKNKLVAIILIGIIMIVFITGNYFEQITMVLVSVYSFYLLTRVE